MQSLVNDKKYLDTVFNSSGCWATTKAQLDDLISRNKVKTIVTKTCTLNHKQANPRPNFISIRGNCEGVYINCMGMPNMGYHYYRDLWLDYYKAGITYIISMDASNWNDLKYMLLDYDMYLDKHLNSGEKKEKEKELIELNISCPNLYNLHNYVSGTGTNYISRRLISYDPIKLNELLDTIRKLNLKHITLGLKMSPVIDVELVSELSVIINKYLDIVSYIVCSNTIPNAMLLDTKTGEPILSNKTGGISGQVAKLISISNIVQYSKLLNKNIAIIGCGGIRSVEDVEEYIKAGAKSVQIGTMFYIDDEFSIDNGRLKSKM